MAPGPTTPAGCASWPTWPPYVLDQPIQPGTAVRIMTGAPVPPGTEAVVPFEEVERDGDEILIFKGYPPKT